MSPARADSCSLCSVKGLAPQHLPETNLCFGHGSCKIFSDLRFHEPFLERRDFCLTCEQIQGCVCFLHSVETRRMQKPAELGSTASDPAPMLALKDVTKWGLR